MNRARLALALLICVLLPAVPAAASACSTIAEARASSDARVHSVTLEYEPTNSPTIKAFVSEAVDGWGDLFSENLSCVLSASGSEVSAAASAASTAKSEASAAKGEVATQAGKVATLETKVTKLEKEVKEDNEALVTIKGLLKI